MRDLRTPFVTLVAGLWALGSVLGTTAGCVYRINIQQGNLLEDDVVAQVEPGMSMSQVRFLLGTPMVADPFNPDRWDYVYYFRQGRSQEVYKRRVTVFFEGETVARVEKTDPVLEE